MTTDSLDLVIRPSGIWDTRVPFHSFLREHKRENEIFHSLMLSIGRISSDAYAAKETASAKALFQPKKSGLASALSWKSYKYGWRMAGNDGDPTAQHARHSLKLAVAAVTEQAIVSLCGYFETFCQCWALNMLLARLEAGHQWSAAERKLARQFWPVGPSRYLPSFHHISRAFPVIQQELAVLPHVFTDLRTGLEVTTPATPLLNAHNAVLFWRDWRNLLVHGSGLVNEHFAAKQRRYFNESHAGFPIGELVVGRRLPLAHQSVPSCGNDSLSRRPSIRGVLADESGLRRGHRAAPGRSDDARTLSSRESPSQCLLKGITILRFVGR